MPDYEVLLAGASRLSVADRIQLIDALWETVEEEARPALSAEWQTEIERRSVEYDAGAVDTLAWDDIRAAALRRYR